ncbi:MAG TPA: SLC13 family permease [Candidatus Limnocylindria bacterium]
MPVLALTLVGVLTRPGNVREWAVAVGGAAAVLAIGAITPTAALASLVREWDVFAFLLGLFVIAAIAEQSGIVDRLTVFAWCHADGRRDRLLVLVSAVAALVTVTLSNDATVLILTPLVIALCRALVIPVLPYAFACVLMANAASLVLPVANPANVIVLHDAPLRLGAYLAFAALPSGAAIVATVAALLFVFRAELRGGLGDPPESKWDPDTAIVGIGVGAIMLAYLAALAIGWPVGVVAWPVRRRS